jgi:hypothetical protein
MKTLALAKKPGCRAGHGNFMREGGFDGAQPNVRLLDGAAKKQQSLGG